MDVFQAIKERKSVRSYTGAPISEENMYKLLQAARNAPSAKNLQPWQIIVVTDFKTKQKLVGVCHGQMFIEDAGAVIIGLVEDTKWSEIDLTISLDHLSLEAVELELGTCWIGSFNSEKLKELIKIPDGYEPFILMTVGHPNDDSHSPTKKAVEEIVRWIEPDNEKAEESYEDNEKIKELSKSDDDKLLDEENQNKDFEDESEEKNNKKEKKDSNSLFEDP
ncbi:MAG: nitroreductase family protein [Thermoplasmata archaeon]